MNSVITQRRVIRIPKLTPLNFSHWHDDLPPSISRDMYVEGLEVKVEISALVHTLAPPSPKPNPRGWKYDSLPFGAFTTVHIEWHGTSTETHTMNARADVSPLIRLPEHVNMNEHMFLPKKADVNILSKHQIQVELGNWNSKSKCILIGSSDICRSVPQWFGLPPWLFEERRGRYDLHGLHDRLIFLVPGWRRIACEHGLIESHLSRNSVLVLDL